MAHNSSSEGSLPVARRSSRGPEYRRTAALVVLAVLGTVFVVWVIGSTVAAGALGCVGCHSLDSYAHAASDSGHSSVECAECHVGSGFWPAVSSAPRAWGWLWSSAIGREPQSTSVSNSMCLSCHQSVAGETLEARGIRVRHSDFEDILCTTCHAGIAHALEDRHYAGIQMDDCTSCHRTNAIDVSTCETCHVGDGERHDSPTPWRAAHGRGWQQSHGMGDLSGCVDCHVPSYCARCHGVAMPHPPDWQRTHGSSAVDSMDSCESCHQPDWCESCHGLTMPHEVGYIAEHPVDAEEFNPQTCYRCHALEVCEACHVQSSHPIVPGVRSDAHGSGGS